jgi:hypothetical protein
MHSVKKKRALFDKYFFGSERTNFRGGFIGKIQILISSFELQENPDELAENIFKALEWLLYYYNTIDFSDFDDDPDYRCFFETKLLLDLLACQVRLFFNEFKSNIGLRVEIRESIITTLMNIADQSKIYSKKAS